MEIGMMKGCTTGHTAHAKYVHFLPVTGKLGVGFEPIDLCFVTKRISLRNTNLFGSAECLLFPSNVPSDRRFGNRCLRLLPPNPLIDPMRSVPLLAWRTLVRLQNRVDELFHWAQLRLVALGLLTRRRLCIGQCLPHHAPVNP